MPDIRSFRHFVKVIEFGSLSRAAENVGLTQPALSQQMNALEEEFGVTLLHRTSKGVSPTDAGLILKNHFQAILRQLEGARCDIASNRLEPAGRVAVSLPNSVAEILSVPLIIEVQKQFPRIHVQIVSMPNRFIFSQLQNNQVDMAVMFGTDFGKGIISHSIGREILYLLSAPFSELSKRKGPVRPEELDGRRLVLPCQPHQIRAMVEQYLAESGVKAAVSAELDNLANLKQLAASGEYESILPWSAIYQEVNAGSIAARPFPGSVHRVLSLCLSRHVVASEASCAVLKVLIAQIDKLVATAVWRGLTLVTGEQRQSLERLVVAVA